MEILATYTGPRPVYLKKYRRELKNGELAKEPSYGIYLEDNQYIWVRRLKHAVEIFATWKERLADTPKTDKK